MSNIRIREAEESDLPVIEELLMELVDAMEIRRGIDIDRLHGAVVGFTNFTTRKTLLHSGPSALIDELVVGSSFRNKGVGRELLFCLMLQSKSASSSDAARLK